MLFGAADRPTSNRRGIGQPMHDFVRWMYRFRCTASKWTKPPASPARVAAVAFLSSARTRFALTVAPQAQPVLPRAPRLRSPVWSARLVEQTAVCLPCRVAFSLAHPGASSCPDQGLATARQRGFTEAGADSRARSFTSSCCVCFRHTLSAPRRLKPQKPSRQAGHGGKPCREQGPARLAPLIPVTDSAERWSGRCCSRNDREIRRTSC